MAEQDQAVNQLDLNAATPMASRRGFVPKTLLWWVLGIFVVLTLGAALLRPDAAGRQPASGTDARRAALGGPPDPEDIRSLIARRASDQEQGADKGASMPRGTADTRGRPMETAVPPVPEPLPQVGMPRPLPPIPGSAPLHGTEVAMNADDALRRDAQARASPMIVFSREDPPGGAGPARAQAGPAGGMAELISAAKADQVRADQALAMLRDGQHLAQQLGGGAGRAPARDATPDRQFADGQWLSKQTELAGREEVAAARPAATRFLLGQGTAIPAVSLSAINTQLPGDLVAQVSEDVYDNITGDVLLIPKGARLLGAYNSDVRQGQARVLVAFRRLIFPSGAYVDLGGTKGADAAGNAGFGGEVNHQALRTFGGSFLTAIFTGLLESRMQHNNSSVNVYAGSGSAQNAAGQVMVDTARRMNDRQSQVQPYIEVPRGYRFRIIVQKDMDLNPAVTGVHPR